MPPYRAQDPGHPALREVYTVTRLNHAVRALLDDAFPPVWVEGEISNLARPASGHLYLSLKDNACQVRCAMFRLQNRLLEFAPANGQQVLVRARVGLYPERGEYQLVVDYMEEAGAGALRRAFEVLKQRLAAEGLFAAEHKQSLPVLPTRIGVVTSPTGAAIRDILSVLRRRYPAAEVLVYPVPVQGAAAAPAICRALRLAAERADCEVLILARGGGSLEDLQAFNEESVARAIFACPIPVVSGVGHETDVSIADFVADQRAATPTAAAELVTPDTGAWAAQLRALRARAGARMRLRLSQQRRHLEWLQRRLAQPRRRLLDATQRVDELQLRLQRAMRARFQGRRHMLATLAARLGARDPRRVLPGARQRERALARRLAVAFERRLAARRERIAGLARALVAVGPQGTLARGYAIVTRWPEDSLVRSAGALAVGSNTMTRFADGRVLSTVRGPAPDVPAGDAGTPSQGARPPPPGPDSSAQK